MAHKLNDDQEKELIKKYISGDSLIKDLCSEFNISRVTVHRIAKRNDIKRSYNYKQKIFTTEEIKTIISLYSKTFSQSSIGKQFGISQSVISRILRNAGVHGSRGRSRTGSKHPSWKGGKHTNMQGYVWIWVDEDDKFASMRSSSGYVLEHRLEMAQKMDRSLTASENVHHKNGNRADNSLSNLELWVTPQPRGIRQSDQQHCDTCTCHKELWSDSQSILRLSERG